MIKTIKKIGTFVITMILVLNLSNVIYATTDNNDTLKEQEKILEQVPDYYTDAYQKEIKKTNDVINKYIGEKLSNSIKSSGYKQLSVPLYQQENYYYCGPTSAQMLLKFVTGTKYTQDTLASDMGTTNDGTYVYAVTDTLNTKIGSETYQSIGTWQSIFGNDLIYSIDHNKPVVCHVDTVKLPAYDGYSCIHYILPIGYNYGASGSSGYSNVTYNDSNYNNSYYGTYTSTVTQMTSAINESAGWYIRAK